MKGNSKSDSYKIIDISTARRQKIDWLVEGLIPLGSISDVFGPPGVGKSTIITSLALAIAAGEKDWSGLKINNGKVVLLGGEKSSEAAWAETRDRMGYNLDKDRFYIIDCPPLLQWNRHLEAWNKTEAYSEVAKHITQIQPALVIIDTIARIALGQNIIDYAQQAQLALTIESIARDWNTTLITVSHSNQASAREDLAWRLNWISRSGGSGLPGIFRLILGCTNLKEDDRIDDIDIKKMVESGMNLTAFCVSKANEFLPVWHPRGNIAVFEVNGKADFITTIRVARKKNKNSKSELDDMKDEEDLEDETEHKKRGRKPQGKGVVYA